jgi:hypothetical protein
LVRVTHKKTVRLYEMNVKTTQNNSKLLRISVNLTLNFILYNKEKISIFYLIHLFQLKKMYKTYKLYTSSFMYNILNAMRFPILDFVGLHV